MYIYCMCEGTHEGHKRVLEPLELKLYVVVSFPVQMLGTEPRSLASAASVLNH